MVQQTFSGVPQDLAVGDFVDEPEYDALREFILALVKDGTEATTGQTFNLLLDATDGKAELEGRQLGTPQTYTPTVDNAFGTSSVDGSYVVVGNMVTVWVLIVFDGSTGESDNAQDLYCSLPLDADTSLAAVTESSSAHQGTAIGAGHLGDDAQGQDCSVQLMTADTGGTSRVMLIGTAGPVQGDNGDIANSGDVLSFTATYPVASA